MANAGGLQEASMPEAELAPARLNPAARLDCPLVEHSVRVETTCSVSQIGTNDSRAWQSYVESHADGTLFHTLGWRNAVRSAFDHEDIYLVARRNSRIVGLLPLFHVASKIAGRMLVSVPYGVGGGILADDDAATLALFEEAKRVARQRRCQTIDLRSERAGVSDLPAVDHYVGFRRELPTSVDDVLGWLPRKARAAARNARNKFHLSVTFGDEQLHDVWRLYARSMRRLASLAYPYSFFTALIAETPDRHWVSVVRRQGRIVAGLVTFLHDGYVMPYFLGTTDEAKLCSAANFTYLTIMERAVASGYRVFDFGRSRCDNEGSANFKRFNGFMPRPLGYQRYVVSGCTAPDLSPNNPRFRLARRVWRHLPLRVTTYLGSQLARHIPG